MTKTIRSIAVFGATGNQCGSVLKSLLKSVSYHVRAITRNPNSDKAVQFSKLTNTTVHQADLNDPASLDIVLKDCYDTFLVTDFTAHQNHTEKQ